MNIYDYGWSLITDYSDMPIARISMNVLDLPFYLNDDRFPNAAFHIYWNNKFTLSIYNMPGEIKKYNLTLYRDDGLIGQFGVVGPSELVVKLTRASTANRQFKEVALSLINFYKGNFK